MPLSRDEANALANLVHTLRPSWNVPGIMAALKKCAHRPEPAPHIIQAMIRCTADTTEARTPQALLERPSYWNLEQPLDMIRPRLTPEHECRDHPGQWRDTCSPCHGVAKGEPDEPLDTNPGDDYDPSAATLGNYFRKVAREEAARAPERFAELHPERKPETIHVVTDVPAREDTRQ